MIYGERDRVSGKVHWQRKGIPAAKAKRYHEFGCVLLGWDWVASLGEYRAHMAYCGESWPEVGE